MTTADVVRGFFSFSQIINMVASDVKAEDVTYRTRGGNGASIGWIVGHLMYHRHLVLRLLGATDDNPYEAAYAKGAGDVPSYPPMADLLREWNQTHERLEAALTDATDEQLSGPPPYQVHGEKRIVDVVVFHMWHEAYHMGQLGTIRTELGYKSVADVATGK